ncbi:carboxypeptidase B-like [Ptychodera flava]|uniref:carboxypeptidase B-like n=1 Tax=Ptychodera flava TaxID=63121 RepID=UPI00396A000A
MLKAVVLALCVIACSGLKRYEGYQVLRMEVVEKDKIKDITPLAEVEELDFWHFPNDLMVPPFQLDSVKKYLYAKNIPFKVWIENVQDKIDAQFTTGTQSMDAGNFNYTVYHPLDEIMNWIDLIVATYPDEASKFSMGKSYEGRDLTCLKIGVDTGKVKRAVYIEGGIHPREWVSPATVMYITNELLYQSSIGNRGVVDILEYYDIYVLTVTNPDGYELTWTDGRLWRKTRSPNEEQECFGTDANRNFGYMWGEPGAAPFPCTHEYRGPSPFSEAETQAVEAFIANLQQTNAVDLFIDYHSYLQLVLSAWGYTADLPPDYPELETNMKIYADAVFARHGMNYTIGPGAALYITSGDSVDWAYGSMGIAHSYCIELRDDGEHGFLLPEDQILPCGEENYDGFVAILNDLMP